MPPPEPRQIKKPRLWLSCAVCRRRKVRCGREQPNCANCVRINENCVYKTMVRDEFTGKVQQASPAPQDRDSHGSDPHNNRSNSRPTDLTWFHWVAREAGNVTGPSDEAPGARVELTGRDNASTLSANVSRARSTQHRLSVDLAYQKVPSWEEAIQVPGGDHAPAPERSGSMLSATRDPSPDERGSLCCDYLSLRQGARARYISRAFWGFVAGKASIARKRKQNTLLCFRRIITNLTCRRV
jgi:hypothetical protein